MSKINIATSELLSYSTILENIIETSLKIQTEMSEAVANQVCTFDELTPLYDLSRESLLEAQEKYKTIQVELDYRIKKDLKMKLGIRKCQDTIIKFDTFIKNKQEENARALQPDLEAVKRISEETNDNLKIVPDQEKTE